MRDRKLIEELVIDVFNVNRALDATSIANLLSLQIEVFLDVRDLLLDEKALRDESRANIKRFEQASNTLIERIAAPTTPPASPLLSTEPRRNPNALTQEEGEN